jgi:hypothetical protein
MKIFYIVDNESYFVKNNFYDSQAPFNEEKVRNQVKYEIMFFGG